MFYPCCEVTHFFKNVFRKCFRRFTLSLNVVWQRGEKLLLLKMFFWDAIIIATFSWKGVMRKHFLERSFAQRHPRVFLEHKQNSNAEKCGRAGSRFVSVHTQCKNTASSGKRMSHRAVSC